MNLDLKIKILSGLYDKGTSFSTPHAQAPEHEVSIIP
jgi:hypothetical protein